MFKVFPLNYSMIELPSRFPEKKSYATAIILAYREAFLNSEMGWNEGTI
jgi:hypothetical protein